MTCMDTLTIHIPESVLLQSGISREVLQHETEFWVALKFFESGRLTSGLAASMCGMNRVDFLFEAGRHGVVAADLDGDELKRELEVALG